MRRLTLSIVLLIGVGMIVAPVSMSMYSRANNGQKMMNDFSTIMQPGNVQTTADYYYNTFTKLRPIALAMNQQTIATFDGYLKGMQAMQADVAKIPPAQLRQLAAQYPAMAAMLQGLPKLEHDFGALLGLMSKNVATFSNVPPGLDHYKPLVQAMQANVGNYASVNALPPFGTFFWFFVIPGVLIILASAYLLVGEIRPEYVWPRLTSRPPTTPTPVAH